MYRKKGGLYYLWNCNILLTFANFIDKMIV